ncbi:MAG: magnesium/cobalt transporter CorA [Flavobacteriaceae bacterium]|nr:magnesium/cobalt transporter CorA [Flavobacteriaceae bacterium]
MPLRKRKSAKVYKVHNPPPGSIIYQGKRASVSTSIEIFNYHSEGAEKKESDKVEDAFNYKDKNTVTWINVNGLSDTDKIEKLGTHYNIHSLILEDIVNTNQRPKIDEFEDYLFIAFKMLYFKDEGRLVDEHLSLIIGDGYVLTFQEADGDVFDSIRDRIMNKRGRIRTVGSDYLAYAILDAVVDHYFTVIDSFGDNIEDLENDLFTSTTDDYVPVEIQRLKRLILRVRKSILPFREVVNRLEKIEHGLIDPKTQSYIRDLYDHIVQVSESIDLYREMTWGLMDMHMNILSNKMNEVMKVLTIIATIFIPLTFIAGIYGMNFEYMPELDYRYGYFILWAIMVVIFIFMLIYFRRKKWL